MESMPLAIALWAIAGVWALREVITWPPIKRAWAGFRNKPYKQGEPVCGWRYGDQCDFRESQRCPSCPERNT